MRRWWLAIAAAGVLTAQAQQPGGTVLGTVTLGDTERPARFATVQLVRIPDADDSARNAGSSAGRLGGSALIGRNSMLSMQTEMDGSYRLEGVPAGDYYLSANVAGYIAPVVSAMAALPADATEATLEASLPKVHVDAGHTVRGDVRLERGGAISGTVTFEDGSPLNSTVHAERADNAVLEKRLQTGAQGMALRMAGYALERFAVADDRGHYRLSGFPPGEYRLAVTVNSGMSFGIHNGVLNNGIVQPQQMTVYAPSAFHKADAQVIKLAPGDERNDVDVVVNLTGLHTVSGHVASATDHHGINSAIVRLTDASDPALVRGAQVDANGDFSVHWLPAGSYNLTIVDAVDKEIRNTRNGPQPYTLRRYEAATQAVAVDAVDVTGVSLELKESKDAPAAGDDN